MRTENENRILIETSEEKDLGVWITNDLKHEKQVIAASQRAMAVLRSVGRAFVRFDIETFSIPRLVPPSSGLWRAPTLCVAEHYCDS